MLSPLFAHFLLTNRSHNVRYPLFFSELKQQVPSDHPAADLLAKADELVLSVSKTVDSSMSSELPIPHTCQAHAI